ncbi:gamma-glutamyltransferase [Agriterribacter sp.]|uniref:gamma-glutamyltransferase n=1 Tax=Agriterribacter sp. TaxID=2821509 RepID=UPI002C37A879|nr:gamma-glutamyltransferase [Agriterribacter sp.]HRO45973.1 gamma-glutamyltransferase [Agriterribacter sp.]HRQ18964.1 gamma-glutamyltransferase [Agriterribacter sp.]
MKYASIFALVLAGTVCCETGCKNQAVSTLNPFAYQIQKKVTGSNGAVVSAHPLASKAGIMILQKGGNAVDAAIATQLVLAVVYPGAGNLGGGGFMVARLTNGQTVAIDYREKAPAAATRDMYLDSAGNPVMRLSQHGHLSAGVPGTVAGLFASMKYASLPFQQLVQPAIDLAESGFAVTAEEAASLNHTQEEFRQYNTSKIAFIKHDGWKAGDTLVQTDLSETLKRIRDKGQSGFYEGETARLIVSEMKKANGIISLDDLKNYEAKERQPVEFNYRGYTILSMPLPSSGGIILQQCLKMIEQRDIGKMGFHSAQAVQLMTEAERRAYADRAAFMGDEDFVKVPVATLTSDAYLQERMADYVPGKAGSSEWVHAGKLPSESEETTHLSIADKWGNVVAVTTTLNGSYGSKTAVSGAGFLLNNEMDDFSVKPGVPNMYGALGTEANAIEPNKRMLSSMTPTIVLKDQVPYLVAGTPGGTTIPTSVFQTIVNIIDFGLSAADAVNMPKFHHQWMPDELFVEKDFPAAVTDSLQAMGYIISRRGNIGRTELIKIDKSKTGRGYTFEAVADKRGDDSAAGY